MNQSGSTPQYTVSRITWAAGLTPSGLSSPNQMNTTSRLIRKTGYPSHHITLEIRESSRSIVPRRAGALAMPTPMSPLSYACLCSQCIPHDYQPGALLCSRTGLQPFSCAVDRTCEISDPSDFLRTDLVDEVSGTHILSCRITKRRICRESTTCRLFKNPLTIMLWSMDSTATAREP